jgi:hypothetical protein
LQYLYRQRYCFDQPGLVNVPETHLEGRSVLFPWSPSFIDFDASGGWDKRSLRQPGHYELTQAGTTIHFKQPDGPREPANEVGLSLLANQLKIPAAVTGFGLLDGTWGTVSLVTYGESAESAQQIIDQQGWQTATNFTVFSMLTNSWDWKNDHYVTNGAYGQWIDWSHSAGGPNAVQSLPVMTWASPYDAPLGALTGQQWPLLWNAVHRIEAFPIRSVLEMAVDEFAGVLPGNRFPEVRRHFCDIATFLEHQTPLLRGWIGKSERVWEEES